MQFEHLRLEYAGRSLSESDVAQDPIDQFNCWFLEVEKCDLKLANGMTLATVDNNGQPNARVVLLKEIDDSGLVFVTHYNSQKGEELAVNPKAAAVFWWPAIHRQVRFLGEVDRAAKDVSDRLFANRSRESNISAMTSKQSKLLISKEKFNEEQRALQSKLGGRVLERPEGWGAYVLNPRAVEFWQGQPDRNHDRLLYQRAGESWSLTRLYP